MEVDLPEHITRALRAVQLRYAEDIIMLSGPEIQRRTGLSKGDADMALLLSCSRVYPLSHRCAATELHSNDSPWQRYVPVQDLSVCYKSGGKRSSSTTEGEDSAPTKQRKLFHWDRHSRTTGAHTHTSQRIRLTLGCEVLDSYFGGGLLVPGVTEISGDSSSGKTQWALQLCLTCQLPVNSGGLNAGALYISTEAAFPAKRLAALSKHASSRYHVAADYDWGAQVYVESVRDLPTLLELLHTRVPVLIRSREVKLVIIDSVTTVFRGDNRKDSSGKTINRSDGIFQLGFALNNLAEQLGVAIVCINQVSAAINDSNALSAAHQPVDDADRSKPALGLLWAHMIRQRIVLSRRDRGTRSHLPLLPRYDTHLAASMPVIPRTHTQSRANSNGTDHTEVSPASPFHTMQSREGVVDLRQLSSKSEQILIVPERVSLIGRESTNIHVRPVEDEALTDNTNLDAQSRGSLNIRDAQVVFAPHLAKGRVGFSITHEGILGHSLRQENFLLG